VTHEPMLEGQEEDRHPRLLPSKSGEVHGLRTLDVFFVCACWIIDFDALLLVTLSIGNEE